jgi:hypothetical protein
LRPVRIRIWIGINMEILIRIGIKTLLIHNTRKQRYSVVAKDSANLKVTGNL